MIMPRARSGVPIAHISSRDLRTHTAEEGRRVEAGDRLRISVPGRPSRRLRIAFSTVQGHLTRTYRKLGVRSRRFVDGSV
jgi:antitoxin (DNA-binding transcriptional repressor) of toxin-antitoxin stability system